MNIGAAQPPTPRLRRAREGGGYRIGLEQLIWIDVDSDGHILWERQFI
jgi:hypothetical protein